MLAKNQPTAAENRKGLGGQPGLPKFKTRGQGGDAPEEGLGAGATAGDRPSNPDYEVGNAAAGQANEVGLKSILEDSRLSRDFDAGVDIQNMRDELGLGIASRQTEDLAHAETDQARQRYPSGREKPSSNKQNLDPQSQRMVTTQSTSTANQRRHPSRQTEDTEQTPGQVLVTPKPS